MRRRPQFGDRTVLRKSDIAAYDGEIGASLFQGFGALCQIIDRKNNKSKVALTFLVLSTTYPSCSGTAKSYNKDKQETWSHPRHKAPG